MQYEYDEGYSGLKGTRGRLSFFGASVILMVVTTLILVVLMGLGLMMSTQPLGQGITALLGLIVAVLSFWYGICISVQRLRDLSGASGFLLFILFIVLSCFPIINVLVLLLWPTNVETRQQFAH